MAFDDDRYGETEEERRRREEEEEEEDLLPMFIAIDQTERSARSGNNSSCLLVFALVTLNLIAILTVVLR